MSSVSPRCMDRQLSLMNVISVDVLYAVILLYLIRITSCQQFSPLLGQNPNGPPTENTEVFINVSLDKLLSVDAVNYRFDVILKFGITWRDSRAFDVLRASTVAEIIQEYNFNGTVANCTDAVDVAIAARDTELPTPAVNQCLTANSAPGIALSSCQRLCLAGGSPLCCDGVWIPSLTFENSVAFSQDRLVDDSLQFFPNVENGGPVQGDSAMVRIVRVQGTFTAAMAFQKFPFDEQKLVVSISQANADYTLNLMASGVAKDVLWGRSIVSVGVKSDELPKWKVHSLNLTCPLKTEKNSIPNFNQKPINTRDPLFDIRVSYNLSNDTSVGTVSSACQLEIYVKRQSSFYVWNTLLPLVGSIHIAILPLFVTAKALELRMTTTVTLFLALTALQFTTNAELPSSSYLTCYHQLVMMSYCVLFIVAIESLVSYWLTTKGQEITAKLMNDEEAEDIVSNPCRVENVASKKFTQTKSQAALTHSGSEDQSLTEVGSSLRRLYRKVKNDEKYGVKLSSRLDKLTLFLLPSFYWMFILIIFLK